MVADPAPRCSHPSKSVDDAPCECGPASRRRGSHLGTLEHSDMGTCCQARRSSAASRGPRVRRLRCSVPRRGKWENRKMDTSNESMAPNFATSKVPSSAESLSAFKTFRSHQMVIWACAWMSNVGGSELRNHGANTPEAHCEARHVHQAVVPGWQVAVPQLLCSKSLSGFGNQ